MRVGNEAYSRDNRSFGIATLRDDHVEIDGANILIRFRGNGGKYHTVGIENRRLARIVQRCQDLPGQELFQYRNRDGQYYGLDSADVNEYLQQVTRQPFTAKTRRTVSGRPLSGSVFQLQTTREEVALRRRADVPVYSPPSPTVGSTPDGSGRVKRRVRVSAQITSLRLPAHSLEAVPQFS